MTVAATHLNTVGTAHGGATMALLDVVHAAVSNSHGTVAVAQDVHTEFLAPGRPGDVLVAEGIEVHRTNRTAVYRIEARAQDDRLVATALARVFRTDRQWGDA
jgi:acyl-CoA thioesterase